MSSDIGQDILRSVKADFAKALDDQSGRLGRLFKKIQDGKASMSDISTFSVLIGQTVSSAVEKRVTPEALPNGTLYFNIAQTVLQGILKDSHELINLAASSVQERLDAQQGLHIRAVKPEYPEERVKSIAGAASTASMNSNGEKEQRRLTSPVENVVQSFYSDYVRENADLRSKAGLNAYIVRKTSGKCCAWCADLAGRYRYEDAPPDVYARHDNCTCTVDFVTNNYRQDVWSKRKYALSPTQRRAILDNIPKPTRYTREQARELQNTVLDRVAEESKVKYDYKAAIVDRQMLESSAYRRHIDNLGENTQTSRTIYQEIKNTLTQRSGTQYENLTYINSVTNESLTRSDYNKEHKCIPSKAMKSMLRSSPGEIIAIHNHPENSVPSIADINAARDGRYKYGIIACHNGNLFKYTIKGEYDEKYIDFTLDTAHKIIYNKGELGDRFDGLLSSCLSDLSSHGLDLEVFLWE